ncbi:hypothetical protein EGI16_12150 [Chryseobacterium sp. G0240]|uniref:hypothetical protein n=1 Tax=Chryseobacterium sp. G0240 TaxID=2487066 RepID=UPI000F447AC7|nr:hypothetical protein [Chryseobacterium sp. G0240]ROI02917.1 hypothetical protein EGI16_12150 [Chryseobacterium sp. G0240]
MKKLIFIGALALISLAACQNESTEFAPNEQIPTSMTVEKSSKDPMYAIGYSPKSHMIYFGGKWAESLSGDLANVVISAAKGTQSRSEGPGYLTNIRCSGGTNGYNWYIVHVYGPSYSGDFLVTNYGSAWDTREIIYTPIDCGVYYIASDLWPS